MDGLLQLLDRFAALPARTALRAWARPGYFDGPLVRTPLRRVLVLCCAWLGDTLWHVQVLPALADALPEAEVHVATRRRGAPLVAHLPPARRHLLDHVPSDRLREPLDARALAREAAVLRGLEWDLVVDLTGNRYTAAFAFLVRPRASLGFGGEPLGFLYTARVEPPAEHLSHRPWRVVEPLVGRIDPPPSPRLPPGSVGGWPAALGLEPDARFALLSPGAGWAGKRWPAARFAALATHLREDGLQVVVSGSPDERALVHEVAAPSAARELAADDLGAVIALAARARVVVSNDSAIAHLAAAAGTPVVGLYSATNPAIGEPRGPRATVLTSDCPDRPRGLQQHCHDRGGFPCPASCWDALTVERVHAAVRAAAAS